MKQRTIWNLTFCRACSRSAKQASMHCSRLFAALAVILTLCGTAMLTSCAEHDNPVNTVLPDQIVGKWYAENATPGSIEADGVKVEYAKIAQYGYFDADGTGFWSIIFVNAADQAIDIPGYFCGGTFNYTISGSTVNVKMTSAGIPILKDNWKVEYKDGSLYVLSSSLSNAMSPITDEQEEFVQYWLQSLGLGATADNYNINDQDFTPTTWRDQEAIYIYDGKGTDITDAKGRTGYALVNMPWYKGDVLTNLPEGFCDDITPGNGWEWALNRCGSRSIVNNNFFALYNKYTGILRFFYYLPYGFNTGNDHVWQVTMTDHLAQQSIWRYGIPHDKTIVDKAAIGQNGSGTFMEYVTPWVDYRSDDGYITPNAGWWAFDIDISAYRPYENYQDDNIKVQMRSWSTSHVSLTSTINANLTGDIKLDQTKTKTTVSSSKGLLASVGDAVKLGKTAVSGVKDAMKGNYFGAVKSGFNFAKGGYNLYGAVTKEKKTTTTTDTLSNITGTINQTMTGTIDTEGTIRGSAPTVGIASPTFFLKDFDMQNTHIGQGTWNLKTSPVVYRMNYVTDKYWPDGLDNWYNFTEVISFKWGYAEFYFLDPSSIEVELNPDVFPEDQIEWMHVAALNGVRSSQKWNGTDAYRQAIGLSNTSNSHSIENRRLPNEKLTPLNDFLAQADDEVKEGTLYPAYFDIAEEDKEQVDDNTTGKINQYRFIVGRGDSDYIIEPLPYLYLPSTYTDRYYPNEVYYTPAFEINVCVTIKMKSMEYPIVFNRMYLPEVKAVWDETKYQEILDHMVGKASLSPKTKGHTELYDYQVERIKDAYRKVGFIVEDVIVEDDYATLIPTAGTGGTGKEGYHKLFDGNTATKWCTGEKKDGVYFVEFYTREPITPQKYYLTTGGDTQKYPNRNPKSWKLMAKASEGDQWSTIATVSGDTTMPAANQKRVEFPLDVTSQQWQYFRFEVSEVQSQGGSLLQLAEFDFGN